MFANKSIKNRINLDSSWLNSGLLLIFGLIFLTLSLTLLKSLPLLKYYHDPSATYLLFKYNGVFFAKLVIGLLAASGLYLWADHQLQKKSPRAGWLFGFLGILTLILFFVFPLGASDIFVYIFQARTFALHHLNPYFNVYGQIPGDFFYQFLKNNVWANYPSPYGPFFLLSAGGLALILSTNFLGSLLLFKAAAAILNFTVAGLIFKTFGKRAFWLYAFNPFILWEIVVNGHNDILMIFFVVLTLYFLIKSQPQIKTYILAFSSLTLGILTKFIPLLLGPIWFLIMKGRLKNKSAKNIFWLLAPTILIFESALIYAPFWQGWSTFITPITSQLKYNAYSSPLISILIGFQKLSGHQINLTTAITTSRILFAFLWLSISGLIWLKIKTGDPLRFLAYSPWIILIFYLTFFTWLMPWYFVFLITLFIANYSLFHRKADLWTIYFFTIYGSLYYLILR